MPRTNDYASSTRTAAELLVCSCPLPVCVSLSNHASSMNPMMHFLTSTDRSFWKAMTSSRKLSSSSGSLWMINSWTYYTTKQGQHCLWTILVAYIKSHMIIIQQSAHLKTNEKHLTRLHKNAIMCANDKSTYTVTCAYTFNYFYIHVLM